MTIRVRVLEEEGMHLLRVECGVRGTVDVGYIDAEDADAVAESRTKMSDALRTDNVPQSEWAPGVLADYATRAGFDVEAIEGKAEEPEEDSESDDSEPSDDDSEGHE